MKYLLDSLAPYLLIAAVIGLLAFVMDPVGCAHTAGGIVHAFHEGVVGRAQDGGAP